MKVISLEEEEMRGTASVYLETMTVMKERSFFSQAQTQQIAADTPSVTNTPTPPLMETPGFLFEALFPSTGQPG